MKWNLMRLEDLPKIGCWPLNLPLVRFSNHWADAWTLGDAVQGVAIFGELGSGKTSGSGKHLALKYLENGFGGLVMCSDIDEANLWRGYLKRAGRERDGRFFSVDNGFTFNFLDHESRTSGVDFAENLVTLLIDIASILKRSESGNAMSEFWLLEKKKFLRNAITLLLLAGEPVRLRTLYDMIVSAPRDKVQAESKDWRDHSFLFRLLEQANDTAGDNPEWRLIANYWLLERPDIPSKTRANIDQDFTGMFDPLTRGKIGELFGTGTNLTPQDILDGKVVVIDIPVARYREVGQFAALIWSQMFQRAVDRRSYHAPNDRPVFLWQDEAHYFTIDQDAVFQATSARKKGCAVVRLAQSYANFLDAYGRDGQHKVNMLLGNHSTKIWHRNSCPVTNEWASKVIAKETGYKHSLSASGSVQSSQGFNASTSVAEVEEDSCPPKEFIGLKNGGPRNSGIVEGILFQSGRLWNRDQRWCVRRFKQ